MGGRGTEREKPGHPSLANYLCMDTVPMKVRCMEVIEKRAMARGGGRGCVCGGEGHHLDACEEILSFSRSGGKFIYFPRKLQ